MNQKVRSLKSVFNGDFKQINIQNRRLHEFSLEMFSETYLNTMPIVLGLPPFDLRHPRLCPVQLAHRPLMPSIFRVRFTGLRADRMPYFITSEGSSLGPSDRISPGSVGLATHSGLNHHLVFARNAWEAIKPATTSAFNRAHCHRQCLWAISNKIYCKRQKTSCE